MKTQFRKVYAFRSNTEPGDFIYTRVANNYHRRVHTSGEIRANVGLIADNHWDEEFRGLNIFPRGRRSYGNLNSYNDFSVSRCWKKSWKDFTKHRKQWMVADDPAPEHYW